MIGRILRYFSKCSVAPSHTFKDLTCSYCRTVIDKSALSSMSYFEVFGMLLNKRANIWHSKRRTLKAIQELSDELSPWQNQRSRVCCRLWQCWRYLRNKQDIQRAQRRCCSRVLSGRLISSSWRKSSLITSVSRRTQSMKIFCMRCSRLTWRSRSYHRLAITRALKPSSLKKPTNYRRK